MANSKIKQILVGTTTYDIEDAGAAHLSATNVFTGTNEFQGGAAQFYTSASAANDPHVTVNAYEIRCWSGEINHPAEDALTAYSHGSITYRADAGGSTYTLSLPSKTGTLATTDDIDVKAAGNNTFTGANEFRGGTAKFTTLNNAENDPFISINDHEIACKTMVGTTYYQYNEIIHKNNEIFLPSKPGSIALTDDIDVTAAGNNTFTGTNTFKVADKNNSIKIEPTGISIYSQVGPVGSVPGVVLCSDHPDTLKIKSTSSTGFIQFPELGFVSAQGETVALRSDIPIKTATLSGTTLSITLS